MNEDRADEGLEHLQTAAEELIQAARAFLDVAEDIVRDPGTATAVLGLFDTVADVAKRARPSAPRDGDDPVEHIPVS